MIVGSIVVAIAAIGGLTFALSQGGDDKKDPDAKPTGSSVGGHRPPERYRTIEPDKCSDASEDGVDPTKVQAPDLRYKDILSVKDCLTAAGWTWAEVKEVDDGTQAEGIVIEQYPRQGAAVLPKDQEFELKISTGKAG